MATGNLHTKCCEDRSSGSRDMLTDRQRDTERQKTDRNIPIPYWGRVKIKN